MAETSIQRARRLAREKREAKEAEERAAAEAAAAAAAAKESEEEDEPGFFESFFGREEAIDEALLEAQRTRQTTDSNN